MMSIAAGIFVLSVAFMKDLVAPGPVVSPWLLTGSWGLLVLSLVAGVGHMKAWDRFYIAYRKQPPPHIPLFSGT